MPNFLGRFLERFKTDKTLEQFVRGAFPWMPTPGQAKEPDVSRDALLRRYAGWAYICATRNAAALAAVPLRLYATKGKGQSLARRPAGKISLRRKEWIRSNPGLSVKQNVASAEDFEEIYEHPFLDLMLNVNPYANGFETLEKTCIFLDCAGDSYWHLVKDGLGLPKELYILRSSLVTIVPDETKWIRGYLYGTDPNKVAFAPDEVIHFLQPNPNDDLYGMGCIEAAVMAVDRYKAMDQYEEALNKNMGVPPMVYVKYLAGRLDPEKRKDVAKEWDRARAGVRNAGKTIVADMDFDIATLATSPREMGFQVGRTWTRLEIADAFGVPISLLDTQGVPRANLQGALFQYEKFTILPRLRRIEQKLNEQLIPLYNEPRLFCAFDNPVPEDEQIELQRDEIYLRNGVITVNEVRARQALPPVEWGDEPVPMTSNLGGPDIPGMDVNAQAGKPQKGCKPRPPSGKPRPKCNHKAALDPLSPSQKKIKNAMRKVWAEQKEEAVRELGRAGTQFNYLAEDPWAMGVVNSVSNVLTGYLTAGAVRGALEIGMDTRADMWVQNPAVQDFIKGYSYKFAAKVNNTTREALRGAVSEGLAKGENIGELTKRITEIFDNPDRAEMIARTESSRALQAGTIEQWRQSGVVAEKVWNAAPDCCEACAEMDGKTVGLDENFADIGAEIPNGADGVLKVDYEPAFSALLHPNCRCSVVPKLNPEYEAVLNQEGQ